MKTKSIFSRRIHIVDILIISSSDFVEAIRVCEEMVLESFVVHSEKVFS
jgi:hypothetical protein